MPKLQEVKGKFHINIPKELIEKKKWVKGKALYMIFNERGNIEIMGD